jgi:hypothetical protein
VESEVPGNCAGQARFGQQNLKKQAGEVSELNRLHLGSARVVWEILSGSFRNFTREKFTVQPPGFDQAFN